MVIPRLALIAVVLAFAPSVAYGAPRPDDVAPWMIGDWNCSSQGRGRSPVVFRERVRAQKGDGSIMITSSLGARRSVGRITFDTALNSYVESQTDFTTRARQMERSKGPSVVTGHLTLYGEMLLGNARTLVRHSYGLFPGGGYDYEIDALEARRWFPLQYERCRPAASL